MAAQKSEVSRRINDLLGSLATVDTQLTRSVTDRDAAIKKVSDQHAPKIDSLSRERTDLVEQVARLFQENREELLNDTGKTVGFRNGKLSVRLSAGTLVVEDENKVMKYIKRMGKLRELTRPGKRTLDKAKLKKRPDFVEKIPGLWIDQPENLTITLTKTEAEFVENLEPFKRRI